MSTQSCAKAVIFRGITAAASLKLAKDGRFLIADDGIFRGIAAAASLKLRDGKS